MAWEARSGLKLGDFEQYLIADRGLNGLGSPFGIETGLMLGFGFGVLLAKWPGKPVRD